MENLFFINIIVIHTFSKNFSVVLLKKKLSASCRSNNDLKLTVLGKSESSYEKMSRKYTSKVGGSMSKNYLYLTIPFCSQEYNIVLLFFEINYIKSLLTPHNTTYFITYLLCFTKLQVKISKLYFKYLLVENSNYWSIRRGITLHSTPPLFDFTLYKDKEDIPSTTSGQKDICVIRCNKDLKNKLVYYISRDYD